jgi:insulysin
MSAKLAADPVDETTTFFPTRGHRQPQRFRRTVLRAAGLSTAAAMVVCAAYLAWTGPAGEQLTELFGLEKDPMLAEILPKFTDLSPLDLGDVVVSRYDHRKYKVIKLNNSMEALLIHDHSTSKGACALDIHAGSWWDPEDIPGLAHFLEHMLFLGSKKYPKNDGFNHYLSHRGGSSNAETGSEHTTFYFDIDGKYLAKASDYFAQFFISPLLTANATDHELHAVDSENSKNLQSDGWRLDQLMRSTSNQEHPYSKYTTGNLNTLKVIPKKKGIDVHLALRKYFNDHYSANRMKMAIIGKQSLDELETIARDAFSEIPNKHAHFPPWPKQIRLPKQLGMRYDVVPIQEMRSLQMHFMLPSLLKYYQNRPLDYITDLIGTDAPGGLSSRLRAQGWANSLNAYEYSSGSDYTIVTVEVGLTSLGLQSHLSDVVESVFAWMHIISERGLHQWIQEESKRLSNTMFRFQEQPGAQSTVETLVQRMQKYPARDILRVNYMNEEWNPKEIKEILGMINQPSKMFMFVITREYAGKTRLQEYWYGVQYNQEKIPPVLLDLWTNAANGKSKLPFIQDLRLPGKNKWVPYDFTLATKLPRPPHIHWPKTKPQMLQDTAGMRVWHFLDDIYHLPVVTLNMDLVTPLVSSSAYNALLAMLFSNMFADYMTDVTYQASLAGLSFSFFPTNTGMRLEFSGFTQYFQKFVGLVVDALVHMQVDVQRLGRILDQTEHSLVNFRYASPLSQASEYSSVLQNALGYDSLEMLAALYHYKGVSARILDGFIGQFRRQMYVEALFSGSITAEEAYRLIPFIRLKLDYQGLTSILRPQNQIRKLNLSEVLMVMGGNPDELNSALSSTFVLGYANVRDRLLLNLLDYGLSDALFKQLRTIEMLGYIVSGYPSSASGVYWYQVQVQSNHKDPLYLRDRMVAFLQKYQSKLACDTKDQISNFNDTRDSLHDSLTTPYHSLSGYTGFLWGEIVKRDYWWHRDHAEAKVLNTILCHELSSFYQAHFMQADTTRELTTMVFSTMQHGRPPRKSDFYVGNVTSSSGSERERLHLIRSIEEFRRENHDYYPISIDWYKKTGPADNSKS